MRRFASVFGRDRSRPKVDTSHAVATNNKGLAGSSPTGPTASEIENIQTGADVTSHSFAKQVQSGKTPAKASASTSAPTDENPQKNTGLSKKRSILSVGRSRTRKGQLKEAKNGRQLSAPPPALTEGVEQAPAPSPAPASKGVISEPIPESTTVQLTQAADVPIAQDNKVNSQTENSTDAPRVSNDHAVLRSHQGQEPKPESKPERSNKDSSTNNNNKGVQNQASEASTTSSPPRTSKQGEKHGGNVASGSTDQQVAITSKNNNHNNNHDMNSATHGQQSAQSVLPKKDNNNNNNNNSNNTDKSETIEASQTPKRTPTKSESKKPLMRFLSKRHNTRPERKNPPVTPKLAVPPPAPASSSSGLPSVSENGVENPLSPTIEGRKWKDTDNDSLFCY